MTLLHLASIALVSIACHSVRDQRATSAPANDAARVVIQSGHVEAIAALAWSPDGKLVAAAGGQSVKLFETATGFLLADLVGHQGPVHAVAFSPDSRLLASASQDSTVRLWDATSGALVRSFEGPEPVAPSATFTPGNYLKAQQLAGVTFAPDGARLAASTYDGRVRVWDVASGAVRSNLGEPETYSDAHSPHAIRAQSRVSFSGDGRFLAVIDARLDLAVYDLSRNDRVDTSAMPSGGWLASIAFQPGTTRIACVASNVVLWDLATKTEVLRILDATVDVGGTKLAKEGAPSPRAVAFSRDGNLLATLSRDHKHDANQIEIWDVGARRKLRTISEPSVDAKAIAMSPDGRSVAVGLGTGRIARWSVETGRPLPSFGADTADRVFALAFAGPLLVTSGRSPQAWDLDRAEVVRSFDGHRGPANALAVRSDGAVVASGSEDGAVRLWSVKGEPLRVLDVNGEVGRVAFVGMTKLAILVFDRRRGDSVQLWDLDSGELRWRAPVPAKTLGLAVHPDGHTIVTGTWVGEVQLWDVATGSPQRGLRAPRGPKPGTDPGPIAGFAFAERGRLLLVADGYMVRIWELATRTLVREWIAHDKPVMALALSPDGSLLATAGADGGARIWDIATGKRLHDLVGHADMVWTIAFSPDGKRLVTGSRDGSSRVWDPASGRSLATLSTFSDGEFIALAPDGSYHASLEGAGRVALVFARPLEAFSFEQFAARLLRPAVVIAALRGDHRGAPSGFARPPIVSVTALRDGGFRITGRSARGLARIRTFVDGRCLPGECEHAVAGTQATIEVTSTLSAGANAVTAIAYDRDGLASTPARVDVIGPARPDLPDLYVIGVGVSRYPRLDRAEWLQYAASDARALVSAFEPQRGVRYRHVWKRLLTDDAVTRDSVAGAITGLRAMRPDDVAIVYFGGHGVRGAGGDFHFLVSNSTRTDLTASVTWDDLARELRGVRGRVLLLLDACHAGHVSTELLVPNDALVGKLVQRDAGGVLVLAAAKGRQQSFESDRFGGGHGAFTWAVLQALGRDADQADTNGDGSVGVDELVVFTREWVGDVIGPSQTPWVARRELFGDFTLVSRNQTVPRPKD